MTMMKNAALWLNYTLQLGDYWEVADMMRKWLLIIPTKFSDEVMLPSLVDKLKNWGYDPSTRSALLDCAILEGDYAADRG